MWWQTLGQDHHGGDDGDGDDVADVVNDVADDADDSVDADDAGCVLALKVASNGH